MMAAIDARRRKKRNGACDGDGGIKRDRKWQRVIIA